MTNIIMSTAGKCVQKILVLLLVFVCSVSLAQDLTTRTSFTIPPDTKQAIVVTADGWTKTTGKLHRYEYDKGEWTKVGHEISVTIGKSGLAWGNGIHTSKGNPRKKEGDGKSPAGVFRLGTMFGYSASSPVSGNYPYRQSTVRDFFVDDVESADYNTWVTIPLDQANAPGERWKSFEKMKRSDSIYEYGIVISHNMSPVVKGNGSAIFFHIWRTPSSPTLGCTSMSKENLIELMQWLDHHKNPLLIQVPLTELSLLH